MRVYLTGAMIGIGGMFVSFAAVVFVLEIFASRSDPEHRIPTMSALGLETLVAGGILIILGILLNRLGASRRSSAPATRGV
jgi:hypothetical protein